MGAGPSLVIIIDSVSVIVARLLHRARHSLEPMVPLIDWQTPTPPPPSDSPPEKMHS